VIDFYSEVLFTSCVYRIELVSGPKSVKTTGLELKWQSENG